MWVSWAGQGGTAWWPEPRMPSCFGSDFVPQPQAAFQEERRIWLLSQGLWAL